MLNNFSSVLWCNGQLATSCCGWGFWINLLYLSDNLQPVRVVYFIPQQPFHTLSLDADADMHGTTEQLFISKHSYLSTCSAL